MKNRNLLILLFAVAFLFSFSDGGKKNDLEKGNLKGKIKEIKDINFIIICGQSDTISSEIHKFNSQGNKVEYISLNFIGELDFIEKYRFDQRGNKIEFYTINSDNRLNRKIYYKYSDSDKIIEEFYDTLNGKILYKYYNQKNYIKLLNYNKDNSFQTSRIIIYNKKNQIKEERSFGLDSKLELIVFYKYYKSGKIKKIKAYNADGKINSIIIYKHNEKGDLTKYKLLKNHFELYEKEDYKYYSFDNSGNWLKRETYKCGKLFNVTERQIEYYD